MADHTLQQQRTKTNMQLLELINNNSIIEGRMYTNQSYNYVQVIATSAPIAFDNRLDSICLAHCASLKNLSNCIFALDLRTVELSRRLVVLEPLEPLLVHPPRQSSLENLSEENSR
jgi:hypothetical protein